MQHYMGIVLDTVHLKRSFSVGALARRHGAPQEY
jgi:hypothetical protein